MEHERLLRASQEGEKIDMQNLGPAEPWQIRSFPKVLRERLIDEAHAARCSVGELLTRIVVAYFASTNAADRADAPTNAVDVVRLAPLVEQMPRWLRAALWRRVAGELGVAVPVGRTRRLIGASSRGNSVTSE